MNSIHLKTVQELDSKYEQGRLAIHPTKIAAWKREFLEKTELAFSKEAPTAVNEGDNPKRNGIVLLFESSQHICNPDALDIVAIPHPRLTSRTSIL